MSDFSSSVHDHLETGVDHAFAVERRGIFSNTRLDASMIFGIIPGNASFGSGQPIARGRDAIMWTGTIMRWEPWNKGTTSPGSQS